MKIGKKYNIAVMFQKNLIVWKQVFSMLSNPVRYLVSEELNSVETNGHEQAREYGSRVSEELNSVETLNTTLTKEQYTQVSEELNSVETTTETSQ